MADSADRTPAAHPHPLLDPPEGFFLRALASLSLIAVALAAPPAATAQSFRAPAPLARLVATADAIVIGRIETVTAETLELQVLEVVLGDKRPEAAWTVARSPRTATNPRWAPYAPGQTVLVLLRRPHDLEASPAAWAFAGSPNDSEWPVDDEIVYLYDRFVDGLPLQRATLAGAEFHAQSLPRDTVVDALRVYAQAWRWEELSEQLPAGRWRPHRRCSSDPDEDFAERSPLHRLLMTETREALAAVESSTP